MNKHIHHLLVIDRARVVGVVTVRELSGKSHDVQLSSIMSRNIKIATPSTNLREAAQMMLGGNAGCIPVVDGSTVVGVVTTSDLMRVLVRKAGAEPRSAHDTV